MIDHPFQDMIIVNILHAEDKAEQTINRNERTIEQKNWTEKKKKTDAHMK